MDLSNHQCAISLPNKAAPSPDRRLEISRRGAPPTGFVKLIGFHKRCAEILVAPQGLSRKASRSGSALFVLGQMNSVMPDSGAREPTGIGGECLLENLFGLGVILLLHQQDPKIVQGR